MDRGPVEQQRAALEALSFTARSDIARFYASLDLTKPDQARDALLEYIPRLVQHYGEAGAALAVDTFRAGRLAAGVSDGWEAAGVAADEMLTSTLTVRRLAGRLYTDNPNRTVMGLFAAADRLVLRPYRSSMTAMARKDPAKPRYARVPTGPKTCQFCAMTASRGFVYLTAETAGENNQYHAFCHCIPVVAWDKKAPVLAGYDPDVYLRQYQLGQPEPEYEGAHPPANVPADQRDYWKARQELLGIKTNGESLGPREIMFVERLKKLGNSLEWIPRDRKGFKPTSDFIWINNGGIKVELKSTVAKYSSIHDHIASAVSEARVGGVAKENFFIDLGLRSLTPKLKQQLSLYNMRNENNQIRELWVMENGNVVGITLK